MKTIKYILLGLSLCLVVTSGAQNAKGRKSGNGWTNIGPANISGRTLTICVDKDNTSKLYAGAAGSGLWISTNGGATWSINTAFSGSAAVSAIAQDNAGTLYIGTGDGLISSGSGYATPGVEDNYNSFGIKGDGVYKSTDGGVTFTQLSNTTDWEAVNAMAYDADNNKLYIATSEGLKVTTDGGNSFTDIGSTVKCTDVRVMGDIVTYCTFAGTADAFISTDAGKNFTSVCSNTKLPKDAGRISMAIAPSCHDVIYALLANGNSSFYGVYQSKDKGNTWRLICPIGGLIDPIGGSWGIDCNQILVSATDSAAIYVGGRALYYGTEYSENNYFNWNSLGSVIYLYDMVAEGEDIYLCTQNGILKKSGNTGFVAKNNYFATMQAYSLAVANDGRFMSGIKNGGMAYLANPHSTTKNASEISVPQGDGGNCIFSFIKPEAVFYTGYYGYCYRRASINSDAQTPVDWYGNNEEVSTIMAKNASYTRWHPDENNLTNRYTYARVTPMVMWESINDVNSIDSVSFIIDKTYVTGDEICVKSQRNNYPIHYKYEGTDTLHRNEDTITVQDIVTSRLFIGGGGHKYTKNSNIAVGAPVYMTTQALDFSNKPEFICVFRTGDSTEQVMDLKVSNDGNDLFVLTHKYTGNVQSYSIYRVSGFDTYRTPEQIDVSKHVYDPEAAYTTYNDHRMLVDDTLIFELSGADILSIALDPQDNNTLVYTTNGDGVAYYRVNAITNALTATLSTVIEEIKEGSGIPEDVAIYTSIIEMSNSDIAYVGTEVGVYKTENFTSDMPTWTLYNNGINVKIPVFKLFQQTKYFPNNQSITYSADGNSVKIDFQGTSNYGSIYAATYGLGIFIDSTYFNGIQENRYAEDKANVNNMTIYPNPTNSHATLSFEMTNDEQVTLNIYDITGRMISNKNLGYLPYGTHTENIDCNNMSNGIYFVNIKTNNNTKTIKLVIQK
ncbi:MAG: T9SS type A sorting domain-containing protein [Bacteroidales bacterium]|nr:T9SS type A sorting domain-containing protein [Bacteroidales bacterium]